MTSWYCHEARALACSQCPLSTQYRYSAPFSVTMSRRPGSWPRGRDLHLRVTNISTQTFDVRRFGFDLAGALELLNEYSGYAEPSALYIAFAELGHAGLVKRDTPRGDA